MVGGAPLLERLTEVTEPHKPTSVMIEPLNTVLFRVVQSFVFV